FGQALVFAAEFPQDAAWIYSHFLHTPSSVARYAAEMRQMRWSASAHAKDIWTSPDWEIQEKLAASDWTVTCTAGGARHLKSLADDPDKVSLVYHGIDLSRFSPPPAPSSARAGSDPRDPARILSVGRAVPKKGLDTLAAALARLPADLNWHWTHIGGGELSEALKAQVAELGLVGRVSLHGSMPQREVLAEYRKADLFVLPCRIAPNGDRDGLPNVLVEAQSQGLVCVSTPVSGIPELILDGETGFLVAPDEPASLGAAIENLIRDPGLRRRIGEAAENRVRTAFDHRGAIGRLIARFVASGVAPAKPSAEKIAS
ncbi:MAG: glycosyltransferase family 4 protein, partial [Nitratireductor sp.]